MYTPEWYNHGDGEEAHEEVTSGEDVGGDGEGDVCLYNHPQLHSKSYPVQAGGDDSYHDRSSKERAANARSQECHSSNCSPSGLVQTSPW